MSLKERLQALFVKYREFILYAFFGVFTTVANFAAYFICTKCFHMSVLVANALAWIVGVVVAFVTNKLYVFQSSDRSFRTVLREAAEFTGARALSGVFEEVFLFVTVERMGFWDVPMKLICNVVVIIINYVFSKLVIFRKKKESAEESLLPAEEAEQLS